MRNHDDGSGASSGRRIVGMQEDLVPTQQYQERKVGPAGGLRRDFDRAIRLHEPTPGLEANHWLILIEPDPL